MEPFYTSRKCSIATDGVDVAAREVHLDSVKDVSAVQCFHRVLLVVWPIVSYQDVFSPKKSATIEEDPANDRVKKLSSACIFQKPFPPSGSYFYALCFGGWC